jgi:hypothetical protein
MSISLAGARAAASRRNGAKSKGPKTPEGKVRSAQNALKHGLGAQKCVVLPGERESAFAAFEAALLEELAPQGALQSVLAQRVVAASWRLARSERLEAELFARMMDGGSMGLALIRCCNGARSFDTLLRYRGTALAELWRALRTLKALQAEPAVQALPGKVSVPEPPTRAGIALETPIEPEARGNPGETALLAAADPEAETRPAPARHAAGAAPGAAQGGIDLGQWPRTPTPCEQPNEPESLRNPGEISLAARVDAPQGILRRGPLPLAPRPTPEPT